MNNDELKKNKNTLIQYFRNNLIAGLFIVIPVVVTIWVAWYVVSLLTDWSVAFTKEYLVQLTRMPAWEPVIRTITIIAILTGIFFTGVFTKVTVGRKLLKIFQKLLLKLPLLRTVYSTCEQIGQTVKSSQGGIFKKAVLFEYPRKGCYSIGFITSFNEEKTILTESMEKEFYSIFMPTTPNPTSGFLFLIPKEECKILDISVSDAMTLIVSGGTSFPAQKTLEDQKKAL